MKNKVLFLLGMAMSVVSYGHSYPQIQMEEMGITPPEFKGVENGYKIESIDNYLKKFVKYPQGTENFGLIGTEVVEFVVITTGELTDFHVINSISSDMDEEVIQLLRKTSGKWSPGSINGKPVDMKQEVSVVFKPNNNYDLTKIAKNFQEKGIEMLLVEKNPKKALKYYNRAISLLPYKESLLASRSLCRYEVGDEQGARQDWDRIISLYKSGNPQFQPANLNPAMKHLKGYSEMSQLLK